MIYTVEITKGILEADDRNSYHLYCFEEIPREIEAVESPRVRAIEAKRRRAAPVEWRTKRTALSSRTGKNPERTSLPLPLPAAVVDRR